MDACHGLVIHRRAVSGNGLYSSRGRWSVIPPTMDSYDLWGSTLFLAEVHDFAVAITLIGHDRLNYVIHGSWIKKYPSFMATTIDD